MYYLKRNEKVVAICDEDLIGKKFEDEDRCIEVSERFYKGEKVSEEEAVKFLKAADNINLVGNKIVKLAVDLGIIKSNDVIEIQGVKHAQIYNLA
jgi:uncharacterized protein